MRQQGLAAVDTRRRDGHEKKWADYASHDTLALVGCERDGSGGGHRVAPQREDYQLRLGDKGGRK